MDYRSQNNCDQSAAEWSKSVIKIMAESEAGSLPIIAPNSKAPTTVAMIADIPEEEIWLASLKSRNTRRAYRSDVRHFMRMIGITTQGELRHVTHKHVVAWDHFMREFESPPPSAATIRRRLSALSSLFTHLIKHTDININPVREIKRPPADVEGQTPAFARKEARKVLDAPPGDSLAGLRDRAILSIGFQAGLRREEIANLRVSDVITTNGFDALRVRGKRNKRRTVIINPQTAQRIGKYLNAAGHREEMHGPLIRPIGHNQHSTDERRKLSGEQIARIVRKYAALIGKTRGYAAHAMRATWVTTALANGADIVDVQQDAGHSDVSVTRRYDRRRQNPEKSAAFFATY